jgi:hypothetical protein
MFSLWRPEMQSPGHSGKRGTKARIEELLSRLSVGSSFWIRSSGGIASMSPRPM